jgi:hypothetical protein
MVWLCPIHVLKARLPCIIVRLTSRGFSAQNVVLKRITELSKSEEVDIAELRSVPDEAIGTLNAYDLQDRISRDLQINRLSALRLWGLVILLIFFAASPLATDLKKVENWPSQIAVAAPIQMALSDSIWIVVSQPFQILWINALTMMILGAVGGFLSGLLQARSTQITLTDYLENMLELQLRPLLGA